MHRRRVSPPHPSGAGYLLSFAAPLILMAAACLGRALGNADAWAFALPLVVYLLVPSINRLLPGAGAQPGERTRRVMSGERRYLLVVLAALPVQLLLLAGFWGEHAA